MTRYIFFNNQADGKERDNEKETKRKRKNVTPRFPVPLDWRIRTEFGVRDYILGLFTCFFLNRIKISYTYQKNYHRSGVHQNLYTYTESHLHIQKLYFYIYKSERGTYCDEPLLVCWPSCMRMFSDVFSCTYTEKTRAKLYA